MIRTDELKIGQMVKSKKGRDKDRFFMVIEIVDDLYVHLVDGDLRKVERPKLKKVKHLAKTNFISNDISGKVSEGKKITNLMIRYELEKFVEGEY